jgi:Na+/melibiose symporter-like transporter
LTNFNYLTKVNGDNTNTKTYYITIHGRLFLERGGFMYETKIQTRQTIWTIAKTTAAILNAISILAIGICGIYVSNQLNIKDIKISELEFKIDSLTKNTVKHNKTK